MTTTDGRRRLLTRLLSGAGFAWGLALLLRPGSVTGALAPEMPPARRWVVRVLGARLVVQHAALLVRPGRTVVRAAAIVDAVHAATMVPAVARRPYRRAALISGSVAAASAAAESALSRSERR